MKSNWKECELGDLILFQRGHDLPKDKMVQGQFPVVGSNGIIGWHNEYTTKAPSITVGRSGNVGKPFLCKTKSWSHNTTLYIKEFKNVDPVFIYYYLQTLNLNNYAGGSAVPTLNRNHIHSLMVSVPNDINEQQKIASILSSIDDKIELNNSLNNNLEQQAFALFNNKFENINDGNMTIGDYIKPKRGKNLLSKDAIYGDVPVVAGGLSPATYHNVSNTTPPVITISASGANAGYVNLWHIPVWSSDSSFIDYDMTKNVYFWYVLLKKRQQEIFDSQTGSAQPHIYPQHIEVMPLSEINQDEINIYTQRVTPLFKLIGHNLRENTRLIQLRDTLLPKLMSGEIDVSNVDISTDKLSFSENNTGSQNE